MKALVYQGNRAMRLLEVPVPALADGEVLMRVAAVGVCGSDMALIRDGVPAIPPPLILGHEFGGFLANGEFAVVNPMLSCGACARCRDGRTHLCASRKVLGFRRAGAYAEQVAVPSRNLVPAPGLASRQAALVEPIANGVHAFNRVGRPSERVAIIGAGSIGMCLLHVLLSRGVRDITVVDPVRERLDHALAGGALEVATKLGGDFEAVFDAAGTEGTRADAIACTVPGGSVALIGLHDDRLAASAAALVVGDRTLAGCFAYTQAEFVEAVGLAATIAAPWAQSVPFAESEQAMQAMLAGRGVPGRIKTVFAFDA
ncbi:MAG TPA: alcohol dehydrogenase catalytic domain-containing protein [Burkholderiaceae bacterium]|jgi:threonine dehydrogenase-like Zn-dependent dehydrogenase